MTESGIWKAPRTRPARRQQARRSVAAYRAPELAVIIPTYNERDNLPELLARLQSVLDDVRWEAIFVDDDSTDGTNEFLRQLTLVSPNIRCLTRIGRRGLSSACIEGMLATSAPFLAVMDADLQHDETALPAMLDAIRRPEVDIVIDTRFAIGGGTGRFSRRRLAMSRLGSTLSRLVVRARLSDPMSGFFLLKRTFFEEIAHDVSGHGFKILLDLFASARREVRFVEVPYHFRQRRHGESKLDTLIVLEYMKLLADKLFGKYIPIRFVLFVIVGLLGVVVHAVVLALTFKIAGLRFYYSQALAALVAMTFNFNLNNRLTYREQRLHGLDLLRGHLSFFLVCSIGAIANFQIAEMLYLRSTPWLLAGLLGAVVGSVWNYAVSSTFTWGRRR